MDSSKKGRSSRTLQKADRRITEGFVLDFKVACGSLLQIGLIYGKPSQAIIDQICSCKSDSKKVAEVLLCS
ncbi:hypothetical protein MRB53_021199 [Persea americana]|uniref:Uncharacterized protein n=1 Tax=Persea americana TaxID=3435 RepID=A0ACC2L3F5_PERAE|nr:hypothetical protein MRB53_021199 [Persea americana]